MSTHTPAVLSLLRRIESGQSHRMTQATYAEAHSLGLAYFNDGWKLTEAGRKVLHPGAPSPDATGKMDSTIIEKHRNAIMYDRRVR